MAHITFIHGIANKPADDMLLRLWCRSLADSDGVDLGTEDVSCSMVYWADVMYSEPLKEGAEERASDESAVESVSPASPDLGLEHMAHTGVSTARDIVVEVTLAGSGATVAAMQGLSWDCSAAAKCTLKELSGGASAALKITVNAGAAGAITTSAKVTATGDENAGLPAPSHTVQVQ